MWEIILETILDTIKVLPFLFIANLLIEYIESTSLKKLENGIKKYGIIGGAVLGSFPHGFSVAAANLYSGKIITTGTLIAVFISTSDEAIPVLLSNPENYEIMIKLIAIKIIIAIIAGTFADVFLKKYFTVNKVINNFKCEKAMGHTYHDNCGCNSQGGTLIHAIKHTINIFFFMLVTTFILNIAISLIGEDNLSKALLQNSIFQPAFAALIGFIPNCASSVILTQLFMEGSISFGSVIAGLSTGASIGLLVLFKVNCNKKQNFKIMMYLYAVGVISGMMVQFLF